MPVLPPTPPTPSTPPTLANATSAIDAVDAVDTSVSVRCSRSAADPARGGNATNAEPRRMLLPNTASRRSPTVLSSPGGRLQGIG
eukprot:2515239-Alexandrium_andersonii.AAC.1